jgi:hypothetical protein
MTIISITTPARRLNPFENARESIELYTKPFEIESMERNQRNKISGKIAFVREARGGYSALYSKIRSMGLAPNNL